MKSLMALALAGSLMSTTAFAGTLTVWTRMSAEGAKPMFDAFEKAHPDIDLEVEYIPGGKNHINKLIAAVAADTPPDFTTLDVVATEAFANLGALKPLDEIIASHPALSLDQFPKGPTRTGQFDGKQYAVPFGGDGSFVVYNKAIFRERGLDPENPPRTWDEFTKAAQQLTFDRNGDGQPDVYGMLFVPSIPSLATFHWLPYLWMAGGDVIDRDKGEFVFASDAGAKALGFLMDLHLKANAVPPSAIGAAGDSDYLVDFLQGRVAMTFAGGSITQRAKRDAPDLELGIMPHPSPDAQTSGTSFSGGDNVAIMAAIPGERLNDAITLMEWLVSKDGQSKWLETKFFRPVRLDMLQDPHFETNPLEKQALEAYFSAHEPPVTSHYVEVQQYLRDAFEEVSFGMADPATALGKAQQRANALIKRSGRM
ncbi:MAG TPA: ABC transporter substrate-binding protein [Geminicoccaceae bacterium]|nr:ABC transporter substrate-binding protein [Geminicoccus sp.]HMU49198.1 ABC transporter substrate-binding protein [Geminicoccaceae bacterium]